MPKAIVNLWSADQNKSNIYAILVTKELSNDHLNESLRYFIDLMDEILRYD